MPRTQCFKICILLQLCILSFIDYAHAAELGGQNHADSKWTFAAGLGAVSRPTFPGSATDETKILPLVDITYRDRWFVNGDGLGRYLLKTQNWRVSASIAPDLVDREESDAPHLRGLGDVDQTARLILRAAYNSRWFEVSTALASDVADEQHGTLVEATVQTRQQLLPRLSIGEGISARWADAEFMRTFFGIDARQSNRSGLPPYAVDEGLNQYQAFIQAAYEINDRWIIYTQVTAIRLAGDAADSPITEDDTSFRLETFLLRQF